MDERLSVALGGAVLLIAGLACKNAGSSSDDAGTAAAVVSSSAPSASAATAASAAPHEITRYGDEQPVGALVVTLKKGGSVRSSADASAPEVAAVKAGDQVVPTAVHGEWALVSIGSSTTAAPSGWLAGDALEDALKAMIAGGNKPARPVARKPARITIKAGGDCPSGYQLDPSTTNVCEKTCKSDADCEAPDKCKAVGPIGLDKQCHH